MDLSSAPQQAFVYSLAGLGSAMVFASSLGFLGGERSQDVDVALTVPGPDADGALPRRNARFASALLESVGDTGIRTVDAAFRHSAEKHPSNDCAGHRKLISSFEENQKYKADDGEMKTRKVARFHLDNTWTWETYAQVDAQMDQVALGLVSLGVAPREHVMIFAESSKKWQLCLHGALRANAVVATAYATLGLEALAYSIQLTDAKTLVADRSLLSKLSSIRDGAELEGTSYSLACLQRIIVVDDLLASVDRIRTDADAAIADLRSRSAAAGGPIEVVTLDDVMASGAREVRVRDSILETKPRTSKPDDTAVVMFTSGSTGMPKGVVVKHSNLTSAMAGLDAGCPNLNETDTLIGFLPLAHILALAAELVIFAKGGRIGYGNTKSLSGALPGVAGLCDGDIACLEPSIMAGVPEIYNRILAGVRRAVAAKGAVASALFGMAVKAKEACIEARGMGGATHTFWDGLLLGAVRSKAIGRNMRMFISGGGPLPAETQRFVTAVFGCPIQQGYGLTETCGGSTVAAADSSRTGNSGVVVGCSELKLIPWEEGGYSPDDKPLPRGEICVSGPNVTAGYYKDEAKTAEAFVTEADGKVWFRTGDIGRWEDDGTLAIIDRKKDLVKFTGGEYVSFGKVEQTLKTIDLTAQQCLVGDSSRRGCLLLCVPDFVTLKTRIPDIDGLTNEEVVSRKDVKDAIWTAVKTRCAERKLARHEKPLGVIVLAEEWTPDSGLLTAALKLRRNVISKHFADEIDAKYESL